MFDIQTNLLNMPNKLNIEQNLMDKRLIKSLPLDQFSTN